MFNGCLCLTNVYVLRLGGERERKDFPLVAVVGNLDHLTSNDGLLAPPAYRTPIGHYSDIIRTKTFLVSTFELGLAIVAPY